jgi:5-methylthioadenosine/S-adenosylhomocysteine deaminase
VPTDLGQTALFENQEVEVPERTLVRGGIVLPCEGERIVHDPGSVLFEDNEILAVGNVEEIDALGADAKVVDATGHAVLPGLHNCHMHSGLLRGTAESLALWEWLEVYVDPAHRVLTADVAEAASYLCYAESALAGTTSLMDMWRFLERSAEAARSVGIRATLVPYLADEQGLDYFESIDSNRRLLETYLRAADGRVRSWVGVEHLFYCTPDAVREAVSLAREFDTGIHVHSSETLYDVEECLRRYGRRPVEELLERGLLGPRTVVAHGVWLDDREIEILADTGTSVAHCPCSNMKLASGAARVRDLRDANVTVGLGSDGEKENNNLDLFEEMKFASLLQKLTTMDPTAGDPWDLLAMATLDGARALGLGSLTGSLEAKKRADVITVDLRKLHATPLLHGTDFNVPAHLVFSTSGDDVDRVWVDGKLLVEGGTLLSADAESIRTRAQEAAEELFELRRTVRSDLADAREREGGHVD